MLKRKVIRPDTCGVGAFNFLRVYGNGGHFPERLNTSSPEASGKVIDEFKSKVNTIVCAFDDSEKPHYLTYAPASKTLVFHMTKGESYNDGWVGLELKKLSKYFPAINQFWNDGHNM